MCGDDDDENDTPKGRTWRIWRLFTVPKLVNRNKTKESRKEKNSRKRKRKDERTNPRFFRDAAARTNNRDSWDEVMCYKVLPLVSLTCVGQPVYTEPVHNDAYWGAEILSGGHLLFDVSLLTDCLVFFLLV